MRFPSFPASAALILVASLVAGCGGSDDTLDNDPSAGEPRDTALPVGPAPSANPDDLGAPVTDQTAPRDTDYEAGEISKNPLDHTSAAVQPRLSSRLNKLEEDYGALFEELQYKTRDLQSTTDTHVEVLRASLAELTARLEKAEAGITTANERLNELEKKVITVAAKKARAASSRVAARRDRPTAPFLLTGLESRGGIEHVGVTPRSATGLSDVRFMAIGDQYQGWTLSGISQRFATFQVHRETVTVPFSSSDPAS